VVSLGVRFIAGAPDLVAQELDVLLARGLVVEGRGVPCSSGGLGHRHVVVAAGVLGCGEVVVSVGAVPARLGDALGGFADVEALGRDAVVLVAIVGKREVERGGLLGDGRGHLRLEDELLDRGR
jgi:hypothetical protein